MRALRSVGAWFMECLCGPEPRESVEVAAAREAYYARQRNGSGSGQDLDDVVGALLGLAFAVALFLCPFAILYMAFR